MKKILSFLMFIQVCLMVSVSFVNDSIIVNLGYNKNGNYTAVQTGEYEGLINNSKDGIEDYFKRQYLSSTDVYVKYEDIEPTYLIEGVLNASQTMLNDRYNVLKNRTSNSDKVSNTCSIVAVSILLEWYARNDELQKPRTLDIQDIFNYTMDISLARNYTTVNSGTLVSMTSDITTYVLKNLYLENRLYGDNFYYNLNSVIHRYLYDYDVPVILGIPGHDVVVKGTRKIRFTYSERYWNITGYKYRNVTKDLTFYIVSNGWGSSSSTYKSLYDSNQIRDGWPNFGEYNRVSTIRA